MRVLDHGRRRDIVLARPEARNAISASMLATLTSAVTEAERDGVAVLVVRADGSTFCAGADIRSYAEDVAEKVETFTRSALRLCQSLETFDGIVVCAVQGACLGGGFELALASDLVVVTEDARLGLPELRLGLIPGWGGTQRLTRVVGPAVARSLVLTSQIIDGRRAHELGLTHAVVAGEDLEDAVDELVSGLLEGPAQALRAAKSAIGAASPLPEAGSLLETQHLLELFDSPDGREGVAAFVGKRQPVFGQEPL